jgi:hypothetical protein
MVGECRVVSRRDDVCAADVCVARVVLCRVQAQMQVHLTLG